MLFEGSYNDIISIAEEVEKLQTFKVNNSMKISLAIQMLLFLIKCRFSLSEDAFSLLKQYINCDVEGESDDFSWIDITDTNILYLIKVVLLKNESPGSYTYKKVDSLQVFQQHFTLLLDKISKGALEGITLEQTA